MLLYAPTIFLSAFLLFQVQPLIGKYILPWFGGSSSVWTTCLLFFQVMLLCGYGYAHLIVSRLRVRHQAGLHLALLGAALLLLPITPAETWKPTADSDPTWWILGLLAVSVGGPYVLLSSTGPLLQAWFSRRMPGASPYRLYALSNAGSLAALLSYPVLFERFLRLRTQTWLWSAGFAAFALLCGAVAWGLIRSEPASGPAVADAPREEGEGASRPGWVDVLCWGGLAACGSLMLLATTNQLCQDVAVVPFLWVLPLSIYLITFIVCFDRAESYERSWNTLLLVAAVAGAVYALEQEVDFGLGKQIVVYSIALFACCMSCHGELARNKPRPRYLTLFYLTISAGGALGGVLVAFVAPLAFDGYWEYQLGLIACCAIVFGVILRDLHARRLTGARSAVAWVAVVAALGGIGALGWTLSRHIVADSLDTVAVGRNFYGVLRVVEIDGHDENWRRLELEHGRIAHGGQYVAADKRDRPLMYYGPQTGIGLALDKHPERSRRSLRIGVIGLGTGTVASYARPGDLVVFYEINPMVLDIAERHFTYLSDARRRGSRVDVHLGDARIVLERQLERGEAQEFDVLAVDAFSSDAIPIHLLTRESFEVYWRHLVPEGVLAIHISNHFLDLTPVVRKLAEVESKEALGISFAGGDGDDADASDWMLVTGNRTFLMTRAVMDASTKWGDDAESLRLWTDDFSNLLHVLQ